jgi:hypothetical protein
MVASGESNFAETWPRLSALLLSEFCPSCVVAASMLTGELKLGHRWQHYVRVVPGMRTSLLSKVVLNAADTPQV